MTKRMKKGEVQEKVIEFFQKNSVGTLRKIVEHVYGEYTDSGKSAVLKVLRKLQKEKPRGIDIYIIGGGEYSAYNLSLLEEKVARALLEFNQEGRHIVTIESIRAKAGIDSNVPSETVEKIANEVKRKLGILKPSIGKITV